MLPPGEYEQSNSACYRITSVSVAAVSGGGDAAEERRDGDHGVGGERSVVGDVV